MTENRTEFTIPKKYKAVVYDQPGKLSTKVVELDVPEPGHGEVLINLCVLSPWHESVAPGKTNGLNGMTGRIPGSAILTMQS